MSKVDTVVTMIMGIILIGVIILVIAGICSVNHTEVSNSPFHALNPICNKIGSAMLPR